MIRMLLVGLFAGMGVAWAEVRVPAIFSDHMVLQQGQTAPVWGWGSPGEKVTVTLGGQSASTEAQADGTWRVELPTQEVGEPKQLTIAGMNTIVIEDVLIGDVWLCAGQSNMEMRVSGTTNAGDERADADYPQLRLFELDQTTAADPSWEMRGEWKVASSATIWHFSAVAFYFGRHVHQQTKQPIGLIVSAWGGTVIEAWTSLEAMKTIDALAPMAQALSAKADTSWDQDKANEIYEERLKEWMVVVEKARAAGEKPPRKPSEPVAPRLRKNVPGNLFNGMISPLIPYGLKGAIWYQGETNAFTGQATLYGEQLEAMVRDWRKRWGYDFPFAWVQLPEFATGNAARDQGWCIVREQMLEALKAIPESGMAITLGTGESANIHPKAKQEVGKRLALWALAKVYGEAIPCSGPLLEKVMIGAGEITISFSHADGGLAAKGGALTGFLIAGSDRQWHEATARIDGAKVVVSSAEVMQPVAVRYAWAPDPDWSLVNGAGLPASPFRTDDWELPSVAPVHREDLTIEVADQGQAQPTLDGRLDDAFWQDAEPQPLHLLTGGAPEAASNVRFAWSSGSLWLAIHCQEPAMDALTVGTTLSDDDQIWNGDFIEVLLDASGYCYYQITLNPEGVVVDLDQKIGLFFAWDSQAEARVQRGDDFWNLEVRIPVDAQADVLNRVKASQPTAANPWYVNICRYRHASEEATALVRSSKGFHDTAKFARLVVPHK